MYTPGEYHIINVSLALNLKPPLLNCECYSLYVHIILSHFPRDAVE